MKPTEQTLQQIERAIRKISDKYPSSHEAEVLTDIHIRVIQETGELMAFDDDDHEITRCIVEAWINDTTDDFYENVADVLRQMLRTKKSVIEQMSILKPYAFVLENEDRDIQLELYVVDDETIILDSELMADLNDDLDNFFSKLMDEDK